MLGGGVWPHRVAHRAWPYKPGRTLPCRGARLAVDARTPSEPKRIEGDAC